jgi:hypothetical protein
MQITHGAKLIIETGLTPEPLALWQVFIDAPAIVILAIVIAFLQK